MGEHFQLPTSAMEGRIFKGPHAINVGETSPLINAQAICPPTADLTDAFRYVHVVSSPGLYVQG